MRLMLNCDTRDHGQDWQEMNRHCRRITVCRDAQSASTGVRGRGGVGMSGFQAVKNEDEQYAAQRDPAPEPADFELNPIHDAHSLALAPRI